MLLYVVMAVGRSGACGGFKGVLYRLEKHRPPLNNLTVEDFFEMEETLRA